MSNPQVTISRIEYIVRLNGTTHRILRNGSCNCGGTLQQPCPAAPLVRGYLATGGPRPLGRHPSTWPANWTRIPSFCPICDCPTLPDPHLDSCAGPGWRCSLTHTLHFWQVRMEPLRRYVAAHPPKSDYPWYDTPQKERQVWLETHYHPPRLAPTEEAKGTEPHALDRAPKSESQPGPWIAGLWLATLRLQGGSIRSND